MITSTTNQAGSAQAASSAIPSQAVMSCMTLMSGMRAQYPEWFDEYEDAMVDVVADRATIERLLDTAPNEFLRGMMYGKMAMRVQISTLTERLF